MPITAQPHHLHRFNSVPFTLTIDKQEGRRFSGTFSSSLGSETVIAVISQSGTIYMVDDDGYNVATMLAPNRLEVCYLLQSASSRIASCTELTKVPENRGTPTRVPDSDDRRALLDRHDMAEALPGTERFEGRITADGD